MRLHINLEDALVEQLDRHVGRRGRSAFIADTLRRALDDERRVADIRAAIGAIPDHGHDWDDDPAAWVHAQRFADERRVG